MKKISAKHIEFTIEEKKFNTLTALAEGEAQNLLAGLWNESAKNLTHFLIVFYDKDLKKVDDDSSFITLSFVDHGYIANPDETIDLAEAKKQFEIDLEIINREAQWSDEEYIFFEQWWPKPAYDAEKQSLEFGISLRDYQNKTINRTLNRILLTRYGHIEINYSLSEKSIKDNKSLAYFQAKIDEICSVLAISSGYRYADINEESDFPSRSKMFNLVLSAEMF